MAETTSASAVAPDLSFPKDLVEGNVPDLFFDRVADWLDQVAIKTDRDSITYRDVADGVARAAAALHRRTKGGRPNIALLMSDGVEAPMAILATLTAGCAYVPLDRRDPVQRLQRILSNSEARLLIADEATAEQAQSVAGTSADVVTIAQLLSEPGRERPGVDIGPDDLAYIIYTSGTTGFPKGVIHTHRSLLHKVYVLSEVTRFDRFDNVILIPSYSVGQSTGHLFASLLNGASLRKFNLVREGLAGLKTCLQRDEITFYLSVPSIFRALCKNLGPGDQFRAVRVVELAGEQCLASDFELFKAHFGDDCRFINWLAATEANIAEHHLTKDSLVEGHSVPAGRALPDCEIVLLDAGGRETSGSEGEIAVRSQYLAKGYWRDAALTNARFVPQPDGRVLYRTGDLGRWHADGTLDVLGRADFQVKVRGHRVSVEEIEAAIGELPGVRQVAVKSFSRRGHTQLCAYVVPEEGALDERESAGDIRAALRAKIPGYMVPSVVVFLTSLPLNATGKVDREGLPLPGATDLR